MSKIKGSAKVWWIVIILIIIVGGVWWWNSSQSLSSTTPLSTPSTQTSAFPAAGNTVQGLSTALTDTSDAALTQDLNSVNSQLNGLNSDVAAVDQSLSATSSQ